MFQRIIYTLFLLSCFSVAFAQEIQFHNIDLEAAKKLATIENKLIFVDFYADWCAPCKKMDKTVFKNPKVADFYNQNFINIKLNAEKDEGESLAKDLKINSYPTLAFMTFDGNMVHRTTGFHDESGFINLGKVAKDPNQRISAYESSYENGNREQEFLLAYTNASFKAGDGKHSQLACDYLSTTQNWFKNKALVEWANSLTLEFDDYLFHKLVKHKSDYAEILGEAQVNSKIQTLVLAKIYDEKNPIPDAEVKEILMSVYPNKGEGLYLKYGIKKAREKGDRNAFANKTIEYFEKVSNKDAFEYLNSAELFLKVVDDERLVHAIDWTKKSIKIEKDAESYLLLAKLYLKNNQKSEAKKAVLKAMSYSEKSGQAININKQLKSLLD